jgi:GNAT superfamily N-acetyltransferase
MPDAEEGQIVIRRYGELAGRLGLAAEIDAIFFEASATKAFASEEERGAFRTRWLGRYLEHYPEWAYLALGSDGAVAGYLVGSLDDPARTPLFSDIAYFERWKELTAGYPAQLHVNVAPGSRGHGAGGRLVEAFVEDARRAGAPGVHAVTARGLRNVGFYTRNGFREAGFLAINGRDLLFLARRLAS